MQLNIYLSFPSTLGRPTFRKTQSNLEFSKSPLPPPPSPPKFLELGALVQLFSNEGGWFFYRDNFIQVFCLCFYRFLNKLGGEGGYLDLFFIRLLTRDPSCLGNFYAEVGGSGYLLRLSPPIQLSGGLFSLAV